MSYDACYIEPCDPAASTKARIIAGGGGAQKPKPDARGDGSTNPRPATITNSPEKRRDMGKMARSLGFRLPLVLSLGMTWLALPSAAHASTKSLKEHLVGHWQLVSVTVNGTTPFGDNPQGSMFLDAGGHMSVIVISAGNARSLSYFGTYSVDETNKSMTMHIVASGGGNSNASGRDFKRLIVLNGNELTVSNENPSGGPGPIKLVWKLAN
jgi:hypothetical protein